ncbi:DUF1311 domain-containing protein [Tabrizicola piscis]|uniref:DUF1311 domain-containing protein n=1 Tax=Tabrizicola piscis TaxID=2494374 RepID=A0A3S8U227_9RHOB|nr:lysozyme inhibitor LprI family protein [Tabrizicola piscis]AZL57615.1 DUF1311 domain-containing protein [Tabrizicola piscis]
MRQHWTRLMHYPTAVLSLALSTLPALADGPPSACTTQRDMVEMVACATHHLAMAERQLGEALTDLRSRFPQTATQLDHAQAAWASYRDATCYFVADPSDYGRGTEAILIELACKRSETLRRAADLRQMFTD